MPSSITEQIRALKDFPRWELGERGEVIKVQIEQLLEDAALNEAEASQLRADVNNEIARIYGSPPQSVMTHVQDETGRVLSSRIDHRDGSAQTRERDEAGNLTDWVDVPAPNKQEK